MDKYQEIGVELEIAYGPPSRLLRKTHHKITMEVYSDGKTRYLDVEPPTDELIGDDRGMPRGKNRIEGKVDRVAKEHLATGDAHRLLAPAPTATG